MGGYRLLCENVICDWLVHLGLGVVLRFGTIFFDFLQGGNPVARLR